MKRIKYIVVADRIELVAFTLPVSKKLATEILKQLSKDIRPGVTSANKYQNWRLKEVKV